MAENLTPATQARLAAEMARMMGWTGIEITGQGAGGRSPDGAWFYLNPWMYAGHAIEFADWAERAKLIDGWHKVGHYTIIYGEYGRKLADCAITPTVPFPAALSLAVCRAVPQLREIMEASDD